MRQYLQSISRQQAILLLTMITLGGEEDLGLLLLLPPEERDMLAQVGRQICETPRKQMLPQLVKEIKNLITESQRNPLEQLDPEWLAEFLLGESPRVISAILQQFPRSVAERIALALPAHLQRHIPSPVHAIHPDVVKRLRYLMGKRFPTYTVRNPSELSVETISQLNAEELLLFLRELGLRELAIAFRGVGRGPLTELCRRLGPEEAERLLEVIRDLPNTDAQETKLAQRTIRAISLEHRSKSEIIEEAGLSKLFEAIRDLDPTCKQTIAYRLPRRIGKRLQHYQGMSLQGIDHVQLQRQTLEILKQLSQQGRISTQWSQMEISVPSQDRA
jgi:hypothetical protein